MKKPITLILISALVLISLQAVGDPPGQMKMQTLISPPMSGSFLECLGLNLSDREIQINFTVADRLPHDGPDSSPFIGPGRTGGSGTGIGGTVFCVVEWYGKPGEVLGSACIDQWFEDIQNNFGKSCMDLREINLGNDQD